MNIKPILLFFVLSIIGAWEAFGNTQSTTNSLGLKPSPSKSAFSVLSLTPLGNNLILDDLQNTSKLFAVSAVDLVDNRQTFKQKLTNHSAIYVNADQLSSVHSRLNQRLEMALEARKILIFENTRYLNAENFDALPFMAKADFVIFQPGRPGDTDLIVVYGGSPNEIEWVTHTEQTAKKEDEVAETFVVLDHEQTQYAFIDAEKRRLIREHIFSSLDKLPQRFSQSAPGGMESQSMIYNTGGSIGYQCPPAARQERLCWSAIITNVPYRHTDGNADLNVLHHFSVAQYRTETLTAIAVSTHGSANPNMKVDHSTHRAYFLDTVESTIDVTQSDGLQLWSRNPSNRVNDVSVSSTSGMSFGIDASASDKPSLGASISYDESQSIRVNLQDWEANTFSPNGIDAKWIFQLNYPKSISDWVTQKTFKKAKFRQVPGISKYGLQYTTEGVWVGGPERRGQFEVAMTTKVGNYQLFFTDNSILRWSARKEGWIHTLSDGRYWFNNNWLKYL